MNKERAEEFFAEMLEMTDTTFRRVSLVKDCDGDWSAEGIIGYCPDDGLDCSKGSCASCELAAQKSALAFCEKYGVALCTDLYELKVRVR